MKSFNKVSRYVVNPDRPASSKARRFYKILCKSQQIAPRGILNKDLQVLIDKFSPDKIANARWAIKMNKKATPYMRALCTALGMAGDAPISRALAQGFVSECNIVAVRAAKSRLKGYTYENKVK